MDRSDLKMILGVLGGVALLGGAIYCLTGWGSKCPRCEQWFARSLVRKEKLKEEEAAKDVDRADKHYDKDGNLTGETRRKERVYGKNITYHNFYKCSKCAAEDDDVTLEWRDA